MNESNSQYGDGIIASFTDSELEIIELTLKRISKWERSWLVEGSDALLKRIEAMRKDPCESDA